jgi:hypothetical protein
MIPDLQMAEMMMTCMVLVNDHIMMFAEILGEGHVMMISELLDEDVSCVHPCSHFSPAALGNNVRKKVNTLPWSQLRSRQKNEY